MINIIRAPKSEDSGKVSEFVIAYNLAEYGEPAFSEEELRRQWASLDLNRDAWVAEEQNGTLAAMQPFAIKGIVCTKAF